MMASKRTLMTLTAVAAILAAWVSPLSAGPGDGAPGAPAKGDAKADPKGDAKAEVKPALPMDRVVVVAAVTGLAQRRLMSDAKAKWERVKVGDVLSNLTLIRTGLGAKVVLRLGDRGVVTVGSATKIGIKEFSKTGGKANMRLGLKYGSMRARVDASRGANDFRVSTPVATLSVRGSGGGMGYWGDLGFGFHGFEGEWHVDLGDGNTQNVGSGEWTDGQGQKSTDVEDQRHDSDLGDPHGGLTQDEGDRSRDNGDGRAGGFIGGMGGVSSGSVLEITGPGYGSSPPPINPPNPPPGI